MKKFVGFILAVFIWTGLTAAVLAGVPACAWQWGAQPSDFPDSAFVRNGIPVLDSSHYYDAPRLDISCLAGAYKATQTRLCFANESPLRLVTVSIYLDDDNGPKVREFLQSAYGQPHKTSLDREGKEKDATWIMGQTRIRFDKSNAGQIAAGNHPYSVAATDYAYWEPIEKRMP